MSRVFKLHRLFDEGEVGSNLALFDLDTPRPSKSRAATA